MLIFGSRAAKHWFSDFRDPKRDMDLICPGKHQTIANCEFHWVPSFQYVLDRNVGSTHVDPDFLYTIKVSHAAWDIHWDKTMHDILFFQKKGCKLDKELYGMLVKEWEQIHGKKRVNLNKPNDYFFDDAVKRKYDHDSLHNLFAFYDEPLHNKIRPDLSKAMVSEEMFQSLSSEDQLKCALEEIYVVATERYLEKYPLKIAKIKATKNLVTSMTKGFFNLYLIQNFDKILASNNEHWMLKLNQEGICHLPKRKSNQP
jgi:hypothetical protein